MNILYIYITAILFAVGAEDHAMGSEQSEAQILEARVRSQAECYGCWKKSEPDLTATTTSATVTKATTTASTVTKAATTTTTTTTTTTGHSIEDEIVASGVLNSNAARSGGGGGSGHRSGVETADLRNISEELFKLDTNSVGSSITLNYQGKTSSDAKNDVAPAPLFTSVKPTVNESATITLFKKLLDNYVAHVKTPEDNSIPERDEINAFLTAIMKTKVMKRTEEFLKAKGLLPGTLRPTLYHVWFTPYSRSKGIIGSSGFEHVFLGEIKEGKVSGFHNWIYYEEEERANDVNYKGYMASLNLGDKGEILKLRFDWLNYPKPVGSMFIGTSPELEIALYTICFYARPNAGCNLQMNGHRFRIKVYQQIYNDKKVIGSAYPEIF